MVMNINLMMLRNLRKRMCKWSPANKFSTKWQNKEQKHFRFSLLPDKILTWSKTETSLCSDVHFNRVVFKQRYKEWNYLHRFLGSCESRQTTDPSPSITFWSNAGKVVVELVWPGPLKSQYIPRGQCWQRELMTEARKDYLEDVRGANQEMSMRLHERQRQKEEEAMMENR